MSTFGLIIPGRPVDTSFQQVDANKFLVTIPNADTINHVVVFLTGLIQLPADVASCIYFSLPDPSAPPTWHYLGFLTNDKPSAIYKLTNLTQLKLRANNELNNNNNLNNSNNLTVQSMSLNGGDTSFNFNYVQAPVLQAQIGISIEPLATVAHMVPAVETLASKANTFTEFINKTASNLFNFCSSFSRSAGEIASALSSSSVAVSPFQTNLANNAQYVPLSTIQTWYENYTRRLSNDENFWKTLN